MQVFRDARRGVQILRNALEARKARTELHRRLSKLDPVAPGKYRIAVYFADSQVNLYQLRQWYGPLTELAKRWPVVVLSRSPTAAARLFEEAPLPIAYVRTVRALEQTLEEQDIRIVLYVNQNARNFQMFRYGRRWHVFVNHGESDKMYMTTNQFKAYDYALIAGDAARARLERALWDYDFDRRAIPIGRPQADHYTGSVPYPEDGRRVILYAPTWEGDRASAAYGSIATHGVALARAVLADPGSRLVYRPHPRSGVVDRAYGHANREIMSMIEQANARDRDAHHVVDTGIEIGWQLGAADVAVLDVSAMVYDRLASGKPLLVTRPVEPEASVDTDGFLGACEWLEASDAPNVLAEAERVLTDPDAVGSLDAWVRHYFGDPTPGAATARFHAAIELLMERWQEHADREAAREALG